jgi:hypothetical protein
MTGAEAGALDPQLRMLLEVTYECLENAGMPLQEVAASKTSVFVGSSSSGITRMHLSMSSMSDTKTQNMPHCSWMISTICLCTAQLGLAYQCWQTESPTSTTYVVPLWRSIRRALLVWWQRASTLTLLYPDANVMQAPRMPVIAQQGKSHEPDSCVTINAVSRWPSRSLTSRISVAR